ncbi:Exonuclease 3'-5' domain-containing protein 2 [Geranomyces variabilis]|uniref:Exonuclease 3'-5' domain-containing protein 2 n=1 Tax=Geranomyces variabilis TaxID=109894 RepID=A0AAD5XKW8_9FUNG|nr:Exonuclease 3'-5' domain-containing protein 2 [Geranomyces variabilis]
MSATPMLSRASPLYDNCTVFSPNGVPMFRASRKKLDWYLSRGLAEAIDDTSIRLLFEPAGMGHGLNGEETYFLEDKLNICVGCGSEDSLTAHHIVPLQYRRHMPLEIKSHYSVDVVLLCVVCHDAYERHAADLKLALADAHQAPLNGVGLILHRETRKLHSDIKAMLMSQKPGSRIPPERARQLENSVRAALSIPAEKAQIPEEAINEALERPVLVKGKDYKSHGEIVIDSISDNQLDNFCRQWRAHFIDNVRPRFLSEAWRVDGPVRKS